MQDVNFIEKLGLKPPLLGRLYFCFTLCYHSQYSLVSAMLKACKYRIYPPQASNLYCLLSRLDVYGGFTILRLT